MNHSTLKDRAYEIVKEKLLSGEYPPGSRIREDLIAEEISMSRTPVREAINQLSAEGFLNNIPRKGIFFIELTPKEIRELLDVREVLEALAVEKCIEHLNDDNLNELKSILKEFEDALNKENYHECNELDSKFHQKIAEISGNKKLILYIKDIEGFMMVGRNIEKKNNPKEKNMKTLEEHKRILMSIEQRDKKDAVNAVRENINRMKKNMGI